MLYASDLISQYLPWYYVSAQYLRNFQLPHWISFTVGGPYPLLAEGETGALSPINSLILFLFPFPQAINLLYLTYFSLAILGTYLFLRASLLLMWLPILWMFFGMDISCVSVKCSTTADNP